MKILHLTMMISIFFISGIILFEIYKTPSEIYTKPHLVTDALNPSYLKDVVPLDHFLAIYVYPDTGPSKVIHVANPSNKTFSNCQVIVHDGINNTLTDYDLVSPLFYDQLWYNSTFTPNTKIIFQCAQPTESVSLAPLDTNPVTYGELDRIHTLCNDPVIFLNGSDTLITCPVPANVTSWIDILPPVYKRTVCHSTFGCSGEYVYIQQNQNTMIPEKQKEELENFALQDMPETKSWPDGWKLDNVVIQVRPNEVNAHMQFFIPVINPTYKNCGWYPQVGVDLERKEITEKENLIPQSNTTCTK